MATTPSNQPNRIISNALHHLDIGQKKCTTANIPVEASDLEQYLDELLIEIQLKPQRRAYKVSNVHTQFGTSLVDFFSRQNLPLNTKATALAERLLRIELDTESKYGHLNASGTGLLKKGSFLQFIYREKGDLFYLGVKVEHQSFLDETDFKRKIGLGESHKIYKACKVKFESNGEFEAATVFDTNTKPSAYWWRDFWELSEQRTDAHNTETAITAVLKELNTFKRSSPVDYSILRNASIAAFKQNAPMDFDQFVTSTFVSYVPTDPSIQEKLNKTVKKLKDLPSEKKFDSHFQLSPDAVPFRRRTVPVTNEISISYDEGIPNLDEKIWASRTVDGKDVLMIEANTEATKRFKFKALDHTSV